MAERSSRMRDYRNSLELKADAVQDAVNDIERGTGEPIAPSLRRHLARLYDRGYADHALVRDQAK